MCYGVLLFLGMFLKCNITTESRIRSNTVQLAGNNHLCSGVEVNHNGYEYILSAGHCSVLAVGGNVFVKEDNGQFIPRRVLNVSPFYDLMLVEPMPYQHGLSLAWNVGIPEHVKKLGHGDGLATHKSEGDTIQYMKIDVIDHEIKTPEDEAMCSLPKNKVGQFEFFFMSFKVCMIEEDVLVTNVMIRPGDSGSGLYNHWGNLVAITSAASPDGISFFVPMESIKDFLRGY